MNPKHTRRNDITEETGSDVTIRPISVVYRVVLMKKAPTIYNRLFLPLESPRQMPMALVTNL